MRAPAVAGMAIVLVAGAALALIAITSRAPAAPLAATATATPAAPGAAITVRVPLTTNMRAAPDRQADLVAIIPVDRVADVVGRSPHGDWLQVIYPPGSRLTGWVPAADVEPVSGDASGAPIVDVAVPSSAGPSATPDATAGPLLPDLTITNAFLAPNGTLTIRMANVGAGRFDDSVGLRVSSAAGGVVGVVEIQRTLLLPGRSATVNTQVKIAHTGEYVLDIDWLNQVKESNEFNNTLRVLLVAPGG